MPSPLTDQSRPSSFHWHHGLSTAGDLPLVRFRSYDRMAEDGTVRRQRFNYAAALRSDRR